MYLWIQHLGHLLFLHNNSQMSHVPIGCLTLVDIASMSEILNSIFDKELETKFQNDIECE